VETFSMFNITEYLWNYFTCKFLPYCLSSKVSRYFNWPNPAAFHATVLRQ